MNISRTSLFSLTFFFFCSRICSGQTIENAKGVFDGDKVIITYDLIGSDASQKFKVSFFSSHDNYTNALSFVSGDAGENILQGKSHKAIWDVKNSLPSDFDKEIQIRVKAFVILALVSKLSITPLSRPGYKRGSSVDLQWLGGAPEDKLTIQLLKGGVVEETIKHVSNAKAFKVTLPKNSKIGKDYTLRVTNTSRPDDIALSHDFTIKPKVPLLIKALPLVVVGAIIAASGGSKSSSDTGRTALTALPALTFKPN